MESRRYMVLLRLSVALFQVACAGDKPSPTESADSSCPTVCPALLGLPCQIGLDAEAAYYYCDACGVSWSCALTGTETKDFLNWSTTEVPCACINADGTRDTGEPGCPSP